MLAHTTNTLTSYWTFRSTQEKDTSSIRTGNTEVRLLLHAALMSSWDIKKNQLKNYRKQ